jgi:hypothetical protein
MYNGFATRSFACPTSLSDAGAGFGTHPRSVNHRRRGKKAICYQLHDNVFFLEFGKAVSYSYREFRLGLSSPELCKPFAFKAMSSIALQTIRPRLT